MGEVLAHACQGIGARSFPSEDGGVEAGVVGGSPGGDQPPVWFGWTPIHVGYGHDRCGSRPAVFAMMAVDEDRSGQGFGCLCQAEARLGGVPVVAQGKMGVAEPVAACGLCVRGCPVHA